MILTNGSSIFVKSCDVLLCDLIRKTSQILIKRDDDIENQWCDLLRFVTQI
jgi:hypothetical protein